MEDGHSPVTILHQLSHKYSYNPNSGVGVIFGAATKKLLYMGIKNKYCAVCSIAQKKNSESPNHKCFKN